MNDDNAELEQVGISPKVVAGSIATFVAGLVAAVIGNNSGFDYDPGLFEAILLPLVLAACQAVAGYIARVGEVVRS